MHRKEKHRRQARMEVFPIHDERQVFQAEYEVYTKARRMQGDFNYYCDGADVAK